MEHVCERSRFLSRAAIALQSRRLGSAPLPSLADCGEGERERERARARAPAFLPLFALLSPSLTLSLSLSLSHTHTHRRTPPLSGDTTDMNSSTDKTQIRHIVMVKQGSRTSPGAVCRREEK